MMVSDAGNTHCCCYFRLGDSLRAALPGAGPVGRSLRPGELLSLGAKRLPPGLLLHLLVRLSPGAAALPGQPVSHFYSSHRSKEQNSLYLHWSFMSGHNYIESIYNPSNSEVTFIESIFYCMSTNNRSAAKRSCSRRSLFISQSFIHSNDSSEEFQSLRPFSSTRPKNTSTTSNCFSDH